MLDSLMLLLSKVFADFSFIRPWALWGLPLIGLGFWFHYRWQATTQLGDWIQASLLSHLLINAASHPHNRQRGSVISESRLRPWYQALMLSLLLFALAGPSWQQQAQSVIKNQHRLFIVLDLSLSMYAEDERPSRLAKAKRKIIDILNSDYDGDIALVAYSGDAHTVTPITHDRATISNLLAALEPNIMPKFGSNLSLALDQVSELNAGYQGEFSTLIISDEISRQQFSALSDFQQQQSGLRLKILLLGTASGAPIPVPEQGFLRDKRGNTVIAKANLAQLRSWAASTGISVSTISLDTRDVNGLLDYDSSTLDNKEQTRDMPVDNGAWFVIPALLLFLPLFRRGVFSVSLLLTSLQLTVSQPAHAFSWQDLWQTQDQQAMQAFSAEDFSNAAATFEQPAWQASANYRQGNFDKALEGFELDNSAKGLYNQGNALAKLGDYPEAIARYQQALDKQPDFNQAKENLALVQDLLQQQQQHSEQSQNGQEQQSEQDQQNSQDQQNAQDNASVQQSNTDAELDKEEESESASAAQALTEEQAAAPNEEDLQNSAETLSGQALTPLEREEQQRLEQWLEKIPDDPAQLMRNKFRYEHQINRSQGDIIDRQSEQIW